MLKNVTSQWMHIGVLLGIPFDWLKGRKSNDHQNLIATLTHWLNNTPDASLQQLVEAVEHGAGGGSHAVADSIKATLQPRKKAQK